LIEYGMHPVANFVIQHIIANVKTEEQLNILVNTMVSEFGNLICMFVFFLYRIKLSGFNGNLS
jgi:hypothetical protein